VISGGDGHPEVLARRRGRNDMTTFTQKVAVVTGASSGIGRALALELARRGARLALCDVDQVGLAATVSEITNYHHGASHTAVVDVADAAAVADFAGSVRERLGVVHQVYNNAGIGADSGSVFSTNYQAFDHVLGVNLWGVIHGTKEFLPHLIASGDGHLVNISSAAGIFAQTANAAYCTSKFAVRGFTESVRADVLAAGHPVRVTVVHPAGVATEFATSALAHAHNAGARLTAEDRQRAATYNAKVLRIPVDKAAEVILNGVAANKSRVLVGTDARLIDAAVRLWPSAAPKLSVWLDRRTFGSATTPAPKAAS
jgi:NAD(P)-dependent dehydrogenase (short-subunit alcohol dehydrogenase family)